LLTLYLLEVTLTVTSSFTPAPVTTTARYSTTRSVLHIPHELPLHCDIEVSSSHFGLNPLPCTMVSKFVDQLRKVLLHSKEQWSSTPGMKHSSRKVGFSLTLRKFGLLHSSFPGRASLAWYKRHRYILPRRASFLEEIPPFKANLLTSWQPETSSPWTLELFNLVIRNVIHVVHVNVLLACFCFIELLKIAISLLISR
jgi:hypothetical protein